MNDQSRPEQPEDGHGTENAGTGGAGTGAAHDTPAHESPAHDTPAQDSAEQGTPERTAKKPESEVRATEPHGKSRLGYLDPRGSEATREMRDTARRRRDAEEKLQQHLNEAKDHVPNEHHEQHREDGHGEGGHGSSH